MTLILVVALIVLPVMLLLSFAGCVGDDPETIERLEKEKAAAEEKIKAIGAQQEADKKKADDDAKTAADAAKYFNVVGRNDTLVSYWRLGEVSTGGTTAKDSVGLGKIPPPPTSTGRDGTYVNVQGISFGEKGALEPVKHIDDKAAEFLGTQGYVEVAYDVLRNPPFSFSVEFWVRPRGSSTTQQVVIGSYQLDAAGDVIMGFVLDVLRDSGLPRIRARLGNGTGSTSIEASLGDGLIHDGWRHVVMTYSKPAQALMLYVDAFDGKPDAQQPGVSNPAGVGYSAITNTTMPLRIAAGQPEQTLPVPAGGAGPSVAFFLDARLDEVALYRDVLDGATVRDHYLKGTSGPI